MSVCYASPLWADQIRIVTPFAKTFLNSSSANVAISVEKNAFDYIKIYVNGREVAKLSELKDRTCLCYTVGLRPGLNRIRISAYKGERALEDNEVAVFVKSVLSKISAAPQGFQKYVFHGSQGEKNCLPCHRIEPEPGDLGPSSPEKSSCYSCHKDMTKVKYVHGPASVWACASCHNINNDTQKNGVPWPDGLSCEPCHGDSLDKWKELKFAHGPTAVGHCSACHNPHGSENPGFLRLQATDLCLSCHEDKASGDHVVTGFGSGGHPVRNRTDPRNPQKELSCASCHNPHASATRDLLLYESGEDEDPMPGFCKECHRF